MGWHIQGFPKRGISVHVTTPLPLKAHLWFWIISIVILHLNKIFYLVGGVFLCLLRYQKTSMSVKSDCLFSQNFALWVTGLVGGWGKGVEYLFFCLFTITITPDVVFWKVMKPGVNKANIVCWKRDSLCWMILRKTLNSITASWWKMVVILCIILFKLTINLLSVFYNMNKEVFKIVTIQIINIL